MQESREALFSLLIQGLDNRSGLWSAYIRCWWQLALQRCQSHGVLSSFTGSVKGGCVLKTWRRKQDFASAWR